MQIVLGILLVLYAISHLTRSGAAAISLLVLMFILAFFAIYA